MGSAEAPVPAVLPEVQGLVAVVFADRQRQVGEQIDRKSRLIAQDVGDVLLRRRAEEIDVELEHRVAEAVGRLVERLAGHGDIARDSPHGQDDRRHRRAIEQGKCARITREGHCGIEVAPGVTIWAGSKGFVLPLIDSTMSGTALAPTASSSRSAPGPGPEPAAGRACPGRASLRTPTATRQPVSWIFAIVSHEDLHLSRS